MRVFKVNSRSTNQLRGMLGKSALANILSCSGFNDDGKFNLLLNLKRNKIKKLRWGSEKKNAQK